MFVCLCLVNIVQSILLLNVSSLTIEKIGRHQQLERQAGHDRELGNVGGGVGVAGLVLKVLAHLLQQVRGNVAKVNLVRFVLRKVAYSKQRKEINKIVNKKKTSFDRIVYPVR